MPKSKYYAVKKGKKTGIFRSWDECKQQTQKYKGAIFKSFKTLSEAQTFMGGLSGGGANSAISGAVSGDVKVNQRQSAAGTSDTCSKKEKNQIDPVAVVAALNANAKDKSKNESSRTSYNSNKAIHLKIEMHFDGASKGNPGIAGCGAHIVTTETNSEESKSSSKSIYLRHYCKRCTNNIAEYSGLLEGLKQISLIISEYCTHDTNNTIQNNPSDVKKDKKSIQVQIRGDSNLIIQQMNGNWAVKNEGMKKKYNECRKIMNAIKSKVQSPSDDFTFSMSFEHVYRNMNTIADKLANEAIYSMKSWITYDYDKGVEEKEEV